MDSKKVLIVEDDEFLRSLTAKRIEKENITVVVATDGEAALPTAEKENPDIILLDLLLPGIDGFAVLEKLKAHDTLKKVPVIVFSNLGQPEDIQKAKGLGATDFLVKANFTLDDVIEKIQGYLK